MILQSKGDRKLIQQQKQLTIDTKIIMDLQPKPQIMYNFPQMNQVQPIQWFNHYYYCSSYLMELHNPHQIMNGYITTPVQTKPLYSNSLPQNIISSQTIKQEQNQPIPPNSSPYDLNPNIEKSQKLGRNLNSIVIRNFSNFINAHPNIMLILSQIIEKNSLSITSNHYKMLFSQFFTPGKSYVGIGKLKQFLRSDSEVKRITLILFRKFISTDYFTVMIKSKKVMKSAKLKELKHGKKLWTSLLQKLK